MKKGQVTTQQPTKTPPTLGDVLYAGRSYAVVPEEEWANLVRSIAAGDQLALHALYERSHRIVFTLIVRIIANRHTAEETTIDVFLDIWRRARDYDAAKGTVLGWIMNQAHSRAFDRLRLERCGQRSDDETVQPEGEAAPDPRDVLEFNAQREALRMAADTLKRDERLAIETTYFAGLTYAEATVRLNQPLGTVKKCIRSGLHKLRRALASGAVSQAMIAESNDCDWCEVTCAYMAHALPGDEIGMAVAHIISCPRCDRELQALRPVVDRFVSWSDQVLRPRASLQARLARRIASETGKPLEFPPSTRWWCGLEWVLAAPGIEYQLLAIDTERQRVSMLVRFGPGARYTAHTHAWNEECHLLDGDLRIDERALFPGDYIRSAPGSRHTSVYSETGCICFVVTSTADSLG